MHVVSFPRVSLLGWQLGEGGHGLAPGGSPTAGKLVGFISAHFYQENKIFLKKKMKFKWWWVIYGPLQK